MNIKEDINDIHRLDPVKETENNIEISRELLYSNRMINKLRELIPNHAEHIYLSALCHHLGRWEIDRKDFPEGKTGYFLWRKTVYEHQAKKAKKVLENNNTSPDTIDKVLKIIKKEDLKNNPDAQTIEDIACIVFVEFYIDEFSKKYTNEKLAVIVKKTLKKMSDQGHQWMDEIELSDRMKEVIQLIG